MLRSKGEARGSIKKLTVRLNPVKGFLVYRMCRNMSSLFLNDPTTDKRRAGAVFIPGVPQVTLDSERRML